MSEVLDVETRNQLGTRFNRRLRESGKLPAVLYGHGKEVVHLSVPAEQLSTTLRHGAQVVDLKGAESGQALLQDIHWDVFQQHVLHVDLLRVDAEERITVEVPVAFRGVAPGENEGGVVEQLVHEVEIETSPAAIPEALHLNINDLHIGDSLTAADFEDFPPGAKLIGDESMTIVQCIEPIEIPEEEEEAAIADGAEPEVIGASDEDKEPEAEGDSES